MKKLLIATMFVQLSLTSLDVNAFDMASPPNSLTVNPNGSVGIGTTLPESSLHILKSNAVLKIQDTNVTAATRQMIDLENLGGVGMRFINTNRNTIWNFLNTDAGNFVISKKDSGGFEFEMTGSGRMKISSQGSLNFDMRPNGNLLIPNGSIRANGVLLTSSRDSKTDIESIQPSKILENLQKMEIAEWRYKKADKNDRHMSPMAEDFYSLFNFGTDGKYINPNDLASVALVASQELSKQTKNIEDELLVVREENQNLKTQLKIQTEQLVVEKNSLKQRLASLEKLVMNIANSDSRSIESKEKIVMNLFK